MPFPLLHAPRADADSLRPGGSVGQPRKRSKILSRMRLGARQSHVPGERRSSSSRPSSPLASYAVTAEDDAAPTKASVQFVFESHPLARGAGCSSRGSLLVASFSRSGSGMSPDGAPGMTRDSSLTGFALLSLAPKTSARRADAPCPTAAPVADAGALWDRYLASASAASDRPMTTSETARVRTAEIAWLAAWRSAEGGLFSRSLDEPRSPAVCSSAPKPASLQEPQEDDDGSDRSSTTSSPPLSPKRPTAVTFGQGPPADGAGTRASKLPTFEQALGCLSLMDSTVAAQSYAALVHQSASASGSPALHMPSLHPSPAVSIISVSAAHPAAGALMDAGVALADLDARRSAGYDDVDLGPARDVPLFRAWDDVYDADWLEMDSSSESEGEEEDEDDRERDSDAESESGSDGEESPLDSEYGSLCAAVRVYDARRVTLRAVRAVGTIVPLDLVRPAECDDPAVSSSDDDEGRAGDEEPLKLGPFLALFPMPPRWTAQPRSVLSAVPAHVHGAL